MCSFGYTFFNFGGFAMKQLTIGLFSKNLMDSINEHIHKVVKEYVEYLEPAHEAMINSESLSALFEVQKIINNENLSETDKIKKIRDVFGVYDLDFDRFEFD